MEGPPDVSPLALEGKTQEGKQGRRSKHVVFNLPPGGRTPRNLPSTVINVKHTKNKARRDVTVVHGTQS